MPSKTKPKELIPSTSAQEARQMIKQHSKIVKAIQTTMRPVRTKQPPIHINHTMHTEAGMG